MKRTRGPTLPSLHAPQSTNSLLQTDELKRRKYPTSLPCSESLSLLHPPSFPVLCSPTKHFPLPSPVLDFRTSGMDSVLANAFPPSDDINDPSPIFILPRQGPQNEVPIHFDDLFSNDDFINFWDSGVDPRPLSPPHVPPQGGTLPPDVVRPFPLTTSFNALPHSALDVFDGTSAPLSHPSASNLAGSSSAVLDAGQTSFFGTQNISMPLPSEPALAPAPGSSSSSSSSSLNSMNPVSVDPTFGWPTGALNPVVRAWDATAPSMARANTTTAFVRAEPRQVPVPRCSCYRRQPLVRVDDTIEWVRPDVMKMVLYFNFSWNAEAKAHSSWEPHDA